MTDKPYVYTYKNRNWTPEYTTRMIKLWKEGKKLRDIADEMFEGCTPTAVELKAYHMGLPARPHDGGPWWPEVVDYLRDHWLAGWTSAKIATAINAKFGLNITRMSVIGKAHRLKLAVHPGAKCTGAAVKSRKHKQRGPETPRPVKRQGWPYNGFKAEPLPAPQPVPSWSSPVNFEALEANQCHYPLEIDGKTLFCGSPAIPNQSWCPECHSRVYLPKSTLVRRKHWTNDTTVKIKALQRLIHD